jgi:hypothetical protein
VTRADGAVKNQVRVRLNVDGAGVELFEWDMLTNRSKCSSLFSDESI